MKAPWRDRLATVLANLCFRIATPRYRKMVKGAIKYGMLSALRDELEGLDPPEWPQ